MKFDQGQPLEIHEERPGNGALTLRLRGEFDLAVKGRFEAALGRLGTDSIRELVIDLAGLTFIDSSGIRALYEARRLADDNGIHLFVALPAEGQVRKILELTGTDEVLGSSESA